MRAILLLLFLIGAHVYAFFSLFQVHSEVTTVIYKGARIVYLILSVFAILMITAMLFEWFNLSDDTKRVLASYLFIWCLSISLLGVFLVLDDLRRFVFWSSNGFSKNFTSHSRNKFLLNFGLLVAAIPFIAGNYGMIRNLHNWKKYRQRIKINKLHKGLVGLKIIQLSDIHAGTFRSVESIEDVVSVINEEQADLILFTGDLVNESAEEIVPYINAFSKLNAKYGVYSIKGNHDYGDYQHSRKLNKEKNKKMMQEYHKQMKWNLLLDENITIDINGAKLGLIGMENASSKPYFNQYGDISRALKGLGNVDFRLLMSHDPSYWKPKVVSNAENIQLTLSGHTHGGQFGIEIPGYLKWSPVKYIYKYWAGLYEEEGKYLYVNRGFGCLGYPGRVGIKAEISILELHDS